MTADDDAARAATFPPPGHTATQTAGPPATEPPVPDSTPGRPRSKRPLLIGIIVAAVLLAGAGVFVATRSDDDKTASAASSLVGFNTEKNKLEVLDSSGDVVDSFDAPDAPGANFVTGLAGRVIFDASSDGDLFVMQTADGSIDHFDVPDGLTLSRPFSSDSTKLVLQSPAAGDVVVIDLESGDATSAQKVVDDSEAKFGPGRAFPDGTTYVDLHDRTLQTLVVPAASGTEMWAVPGVVVALDGERSLTTVGKKGLTTLGVYVRDDEVGSIDIDGQVIGALLTGDDTALVVTLEGDVVKVDLGSDTTTSVGSLPGPVVYTAALSHDRLFVVGDDAPSYLLDDAGKTIIQLDTTDDEDGNAVAPNIGPAGARPGARCFITQPIPPGGPFITEGGGVALREVATGKVLTELESSAILLDTPDGCTAVPNVDEVADVALDGKLQQFDGYINVVAVAPDLSRVVVNGGGKLVLIDVGTGEKTELDRAQYAFVQSIG